MLSHTYIPVNILLIYTVGKEIDMCVNNYIYVDYALPTIHVSVHIVMNISTGTIICMCEYKYYLAVESQLLL